MDRAQLDGHDDVVTFFGVPWEHYVSMDRLRAPSVHRAYLDGVLELVSPGEYHEVVKKLLARFLEAYALHRGTVLNGHGSETLRKKPRNAGVEPDECYFLGTTPKPFPDLAIEVVSANESIDKLEIYRRLRVREVWLWRDDKL
ncbi:MAG: Uma2 family endonuclease, partial [Acidobacteriota bacterium]